MIIRKDLALNNSGFIFDPITGESYSLNKLGIEIFNYLNEGKEAEEIKYNILEKYAVSEIEFEKSFQDFFGLLKEFNLLENE